MFSFFNKTEQAQGNAIAQAVERSSAVVEFRPDGTVIRANDTFLQVMGYTLGEVAGKHHRMFVPERLVQEESYDEFWHRLNKGLFQAGRFERVSKQGTPVWIQGAYTPIMTGGKVSRIIKVASDITAATNAEKNMQRLFDAIDLSKARIEFNPEGIIQDANDRFLDAVGYRRDEVIGHHHRMFLEPEESASDAYALFWQALRDGTPQTGEFKRLTKDRSSIWIQATYTPVLGLDGQIAKIVKFADNVTEQKISSARFESRLAAIRQSQAVVEFTPDGTILEANDIFLQTMGYNIEDIIGKHHRMFVDADYAKSPEYADYWERLAGGEAQNGSFKRVSSRGDVTWFQASYAPIRDHEGTVVRVIKIATNITKAVDRQEKAKAVGVSVAGRLNEISASSNTAKNKTSAAARASNDTSETVQMVASAAEEFGASAREIASSVAATRDAAARANDETLSADRSAGMLEKATDAMSGIVGLIQDIAEQINLLALNATIEAARAGDAGRGFSVVASEVKNLANQVGTAIGRITTEIDNVQNVSGDVVKSLQSIRKEVAHANDSVSTVAAAIEEQSATSQEITTTIQAAATAVSEINENLKEIADIVIIITNAAEETQELARSLAEDEQS